MVKKIVTICGSKTKHLKEMREAELMLAAAGYISFMPIVEAKNVSLAILRETSRQKIDISNAIFVTDVNGYIGDDTKREIEYAQKRGKEIIFYHSFFKNYIDHFCKNSGYSFKEVENARGERQYNLYDAQGKFRLGTTTKHGLIDSITREKKTLKEQGLYKTYIPSEEEIETEEKER